MATTSSVTHLGAVKAIVDAYLRRYPQEKESLASLTEQLSAMDETLTCRSNMVGHLTASALILRTDHVGKNEALLIHHLGLKRWLQPGGHLESDEDLEAGARRELLEETGLHYIELLPGFSGPGSVTDIDSHVIPENPRKGEGRHLHHDFQYVYRFLGGEISLQEDEVGKFHWFPVEELLAGKFGSRLKRTASKLF